MLKVKICGMRESANIRAVAEMQPDLMGFIFYPKSARYVGEDFVIPQLPPAIQKTGVFVKSPLEEVLALASRHALGAIQLHGGESPAYCAEVRAAGLEVIKVFPMNEHFDFGDVTPFEKVADYFLFDTAGQTYGGHGKVFDWGLLDHYHGDTPFFVAGGISNDNLDSLLQLNHPQFAGIDVNSKYEVSPGLKDLGALREMFYKKNNRLAQQGEI